MPWLHSHHVLYPCVIILYQCCVCVFLTMLNQQVRKEYRKFIRKHSWLPKCLRCSKLSGGTGSSSGSSGAGKERRTSLYAGSNSNPSGPNSHSTDNSVLSPHATSVGTNNIVIANNLNNARPTALVQVLTRTDLNNASTTTTNHNRLHNVSQQGTATVKRFSLRSSVFFFHVTFSRVSNRQFLCSSLRTALTLFFSIRRLVDISACI